jgi:signal peptidase I
MSQDGKNSYDDEYNESADGITLESSSDREDIMQESQVDDMEQKPLSDEMIEEDKAEDRKSKKGSLVKELLIYAIIFVIGLYIIPNFVLQRTIVKGDSMENTLHSKESLLVDKLSYNIGNPKRFDIVVFFPYGRDVDEYYVKRVIGLPGETIQIIGEDIYINGEVLEENYGKDPITYAGIAEEPITLADDEYFLMGDNREISYDSRYEDIGPVHRDLIEGKAFLRVWPLDKFGFVD